MTNFTNTKRDLIVKTAGKGGKIFTVDFIKKDGSPRTMNCRLGVTKHLKTGASSTVAHIPEYVTVFDVQKEAYRNLNLETLTRVSGAGVTVEFK